MRVSVRVCTVRGEREEVNFLSLTSFDKMPEMKEVDPSEHSHLPAFSRQHSKLSTCKGVVIRG